MHGGFPELLTFFWEPPPPQEKTKCQTGLICTLNHWGHVKPQQLLSRKDRVVPVYKQENLC